MNGHNEKARVPSQIKDKGVWKTQSFLNGEWIDAKTNTTFSVLDPATNKSLDEVADCGVEETREAITHAHKAFQSWSQKTGKERSDVLTKLAELMKAAIDDLATIITLENGKSLAEAKVEITGSIQQVEWFSGEAQRNYGDVIPSPIGKVRNIVIRQPIGVAGLIVPWNFPALMLVRKAAAALAAGCAIVAKAPSETPFSTLAFAELCSRAGLPAGCFNAISSKRSQPIGQEMCTNPLVRKISFTGSTNVGRLLASQSASTLKKCSFELGGNAPFIVFDDAELGPAVESAAGVKFRCSGQVCIASNRILVQRGIYDKFAAALVEKVKAFKVGPGIESDTTHGPLINAKAVEKVNEHVDDAVKRGAKVVEGGKIIKGNFYAPTVMTGGTPDMLAHIDETFGPLAVLYPFDSEEDAVRMANDTEYGLAGYFWSSNLSRAWRVAEALNVGMVGINGAPVAQACAPFGGVNQSGYGREGSKYGMEEYQEMKLIAMMV